ncbi:hypothetical protein BDY24DRAFT_380935 [Mrakia frigida]|uniref:uncharacterized protein n=1 Tax=Mrakia frigida TaxID=29902 RepID=UPI003FCC06C2
MFFSLSTILAALSLLSFVSAHGVVTEVKGANGITTTGFANTPGTPRDTGSARTAQGDTSVIRDDSCGRTRDAGQVNIAQ